MVKAPELCDLANTCNIEGDELAERCTLDRLTAHVSYWYSRFSVQTCCWMNVYDPAAISRGQI